MGSKVMRTDDAVAPHVRRSRTAWVTAAGLVLMVVAAVFLIHAIDRRTSLSAAETAQLRQIIAERSHQRDAEHVVTQRQLDDQARALCAVVVDFASRAHTPEAREVFKRATVRLNCATLTKVTP